MERRMLHCDMNNYFASVECIGKPDLKSVPAAVCGDPELRHGIVLAKNEPAKKFGIVTGESSFSAKSKCPGLIILPPHYRVYKEYADMAREIFSDYSPKIYPYGIDEAWIDVTEASESFSDAVHIADELRRRIRTELGLTASVGVSFNYIFAKLASDMKKPDATSTVSRESFRRTVWGLPAFSLLFVGGATRRALRCMHILSIGDLACEDPLRLSSKLGKRGVMLWEFANGNDSSFVPPKGDEEEIKSIGNSVTPPHDIRNFSDAESFLCAISFIVAKRLTKHRMKTECVSVIIKRNDFSSLTRQKKLSLPTDDPYRIFDCARALLKSNHTFETHDIRSIGIRADKLSAANIIQLSFFDGEIRPKPGIGYESALESLQKRFGGIFLEPFSDEEDESFNKYQENEYVRKIYG